MIADSVNILGQKWTILSGTRKQYPELSDRDGSTDASARTIYVHHTSKPPKPHHVQNREQYERRCLRHEIIHAFMYESGLHYSSLRYSGAWAVNEEMVDWIAIQHEKLHTAFIEAGAI